MVFSSVVFLFFFLPVCLLVYFALPGIRLRNIFLLLASLFFYAWGEPVFLLVMLFSCLVNYLAGILLERTHRKKWPLIAGVVINLLILVIAKYSDFLVDNFNLLLPTGFQLAHPNIPLPIGISFFTFQALSYLVDIWRGDAHVQHDPLRLSLYISLFPQLIAGPIVRYHHIATELHRRVHHLTKFRYGAERFITGLAKKVLIANTLGKLADNIIDGQTEWGMASAWVGIIAYALQIYYDFSGYSDMAIGLGRMFGFNFHENFMFPYKARSIQEFWRRWHISLSTWFRDYVYIPLGGNRKGTGRTYGNLILVFFLTGLWHGASWNFVLWGMIHGSFMLLERVGLRRKLKKLGIVSNLYAVFVVLVAWVFFRIEDFATAWTYLGAMFSFNIHSLFVSISTMQLTALIFGVLFSFDWWNRIPVPRRVHMPAIMVRQTAYLIMFILCCLEVATSTYNPFIYYRF